MNKLQRHAEKERVLTLYKEGKPVIEILPYTNASERTVYRWLRNEGLIKSERSARQRYLTEFNYRMGHINE